MKPNTKPNRLPLFAKLVIYFLSFTVVILGILWVVQVGLFDVFYRRVTTHRMEEFQDQLKQSAPADFETAIRGMGENMNVCTGIYSVGKSSLSLVADYHTEKNCFVHSIRDEQILYLYRLVSSRESKSFQASLSSEQIDQYFPDKHSQQTLIVLDGNTIARFPDQFRFTTGQSSDSMVSVFLFSSEGNSYFCLMSTMLIPANATAQTLSVQLSAVTLLALVLCLLLSLVLAKTLSVPLSRLTKNAALLPAGQFDSQGIGGSREIVQLEQTLAQSAREIQKTERLRKELLANVSHDLRTPLTLIESYGEMMQDMPGEVTKENLQVIIDESVRLSRLVNDILDHSKLESETAVLHCAPLELGALLREIGGRLRSFTEAKGYRLELNVSGEYPVCADEGKLTQAIYNLAINAFGHTGEDKTVWINLLPKDDGVRLEIRDSGAGIPPELQEKIWDRYYRIPQENLPEESGSGLGLSITKKILELHGFPFGVISQEGQGACFWMELPLLAQEQS